MNDGGQLALPGGNREPRDVTLVDPVVPRLPAGEWPVRAGWPSRRPDVVTLVAPARRIP